MRERPNLQNNYANQQQQRQNFSQQKDNNQLRPHNMDNSSNTNNKSQQTMYQRQYNQNPFTSYPRGFQNKYWRNQNQNTQRFNNW